MAREGARFGGATCAGGSHDHALRSYIWDGQCARRWRPLYTAGAAPTFASFTPRLTCRFRRTCRSLRPGTRGQCGTCTGQAAARCPGRPARGARTDPGVVQRGQHRDVGNDAHGAARKGGARLLLLLHLGPTHGAGQATHRAVAHALAVRRVEVRLGALVEAALKPDAARGVSGGAEQRSASCGAHHATLEYPARRSCSEAASERTPVWQATSTPGAVLGTWACTSARKLALALVCAVPCHQPPVPKSAHCLSRPKTLRSSSTSNSGTRTLLCTAARDTSSARRTSSSTQPDDCSARHSLASTSRTPPATACGRASAHSAPP